MARVPTYEGNQIRDAALPGVRQSISGINANAFGGNADNERQVLGALGDVNQDMQREQKKKDADKAAEQAFAAESAFGTEYIAKQQELQQRQGKNAAGVQQELGKWVQENSSKHAGTITDERARKLFNQSVLRTGMQAQQWAGGWEKQQGEIALDTEWKSSKDVLAQSAINDSRPEVVNASIAEIQKRNAFQSQRKGLGDDWLKSANASDIAELHGAVLKNAKESDAPGSVTGYLQQHADTIPESLKATYGSWVHERTIDESAKGFADGFIAQGVSYSEALKLTRDKYAGKDEDRYVSRLKERYGEAEMIKRERGNEIEESIHKKLFADGDFRNVSMDDIRVLADNNIDKGLHLKGLKAKDDERRARGGDYADYTDYSTRDYLSQQIVQGNIKDPQQLAIYRGALDRGDFGKMEALIESQQTIKDAAAMDAYKESLPAKERNEANWSVKNYARAAAFQAYAASEIKRSGRTQDVKALAAKFQLKGKEMSGAFWSPDKDTTYGDAVIDGTTDKFQESEPLARNAITEGYLNKTSKHAVGQRFQQGGKVYEYDGANYNEVK